MGRRWRTIGAIVLIVVLAFGAQAGLARQQTRIAVTHWQTLLYGVPYAIALDTDLFGDQDIHVTQIVTSDGGATTLHHLLTGEVTFAEVSTLAAVSAIHEGAPFVIVGGGAQSVAEILWVTREGESIGSIEDLKGKRVAYTTSGSVTHAALVLSLDRAEGIELSDVTLVEAGGLMAGLNALKEGVVDAAPIMDPVWAQQEGDWQPVFWAKEYVPRYMQTVLVTTRQTLQEQPELVRGLMHARRQAVELLYADRELSSEILAEAYGIPLDAARRSIVTAATAGWWSRGALEREGLLAVEEALKAVGGDFTVEWHRIVDQSLLPVGERINLP